MAEERNLATARATDSDEEDATKAELQRRMEEARESITQTVSEIKETVTNQYYSVKESVTEALDWREQYRKRPLAWSIGAASVGLITGYAVMGALKGDGRDAADDDYESYPSSEETDVYSTTGATPARYPSDEGERSSSSAQRSRVAVSSPARAAQAVASGAYGSSAYASGGARAERDSSTALEAAGPGEEAQKPSLFERFKETRAYDKLEAEVGNLGNRLVEELSSVGQNVVLPILFGKIKDMFGLDLSNKQQQQGRRGEGGSSSGSSRPSSTTSASASSASRGGQQQASAASAGSSSGASYGTSENVGYGSASAGAREDVGPGNSATSDNQGTGNTGAGQS